MSFLSGRGRNGLLRPPPPPKVVIPPIKVNDINSAARQAKRHFIWRAALERKLSRTGFTIQRSSAAGRLVEIQLPVNLYTAGWKIMTHSVIIHSLNISQNWQFQIFSNCNFYAQFNDHSSYLVTPFCNLLLFGLDQAFFRPRQKNSRTKNLKTQAKNSRIQQILV